MARQKAKFLDNAPDIFEQTGPRSEEQGRTADLECLIGRLMLGLEATKKASNILHAHLSKICPIAFICTVLDYPHSSFYYERDEHELRAAIVQVTGE